MTPSLVDAVDDLRSRWRAFVSADSETAKRGAEYYLVVFFRKHIEQSGTLIPSVLAPVQLLDVSEQEKIRIYEIAASALFANACPLSDQKAINETVRQRLESYAKPSAQLPQVLQSACYALNLLPPDQRTPQNVDILLGFFRNMQGNYLKMILEEIPQFPENQRVDYFQLRLNQKVVEILSLFPPDNKCTPLKAIFPTIKSFQGDECRIHKYKCSLELIPKEDRLQVLELLSLILREMPSNALTIDFIRTLEHMEEHQRVPFLKGLEPLINEIGVEEAFEAIREVGPFIDITSGSPITRARIEGWSRLIEAMMQGATPIEENELEKTLRKIPTTELDEFARVVTPLCAEIPSVANRLFLLDFFLLHFISQLPEPLLGFLAALSGMNLNQDQPLLTSSTRPALDLMPTMGELLKQLPAVECNEDLMNVIVTLLKLHPSEKINLILKTAARLYPEISANLAVLICAVELLPSADLPTCTQEHPLLKAHLAILNGVDMEWVHEMIAMISKFPAEKILSAASFCSQMRIGGQRANLLRILSFFPVSDHPQAAAKYQTFLNSALIKDGSNCKLTEAIYREYLMKVTEGERLDAIEHFGYVFDDEQFRSANTRRIQGLDQDDPRAVARYLELINAFHKNLSNVTVAMIAIPEQHFGTIFRWTAWICRHPINDKLKVLQAMSKVPPNLLESTATQIVSQLDKLKNGNAIAAAINNRPRQ